MSARTLFSSSVLNSPFSYKILPSTIVMHTSPACAEQVRSAGVSMVLYPLYDCAALVVGSLIALVLAGPVLD